MTDIVKLQTRIAALIAKAESTQNENESLAFMAKATELLDKYNIDVMTIGGHNDPLGKQFGCTYKKAEIWKRSLMFSVARLYYCNGLNVNRAVGDPYALIYGREGARATFKLMWPFILKQVNRQARGLSRGAKTALAQHKAHIATALQIRIEDILRKREAEATPLQTEYGLIVIDENEALINKEWPNLGSVSTRGKYTKEALDAAAKIALDVQLNKQSNTRRLT